MLTAVIVLALVAAVAAAAIYLAPADARIVAWTAAGPTRIALLPPLASVWTALVAGVGGAAAVVVATRLRKGDARRVGAALAPLLLIGLWALPYVPWLADRAPMLLTLDGPLKWVVLIAAVAWTAANAVRWRPQFFIPSRALIFVVSLVLYAWLGARFTDAVGLSGDEPHYLVIAHSLLVDRDLDIANNHERRDYRAFYGGTLGPDYLRRGQHGEIYSIHAPGLPALLLPAYAVAGAPGAVAGMALLAAFAALGIFDLAARVAGGAAATLTWAVVCLTVPFVPHAWLIYPEIACAAAVAWSLRWTEEADTSWGGSAANGAILAALPWLHTKFVVLLALFAGWHLVRLWPRVRQMIAFAAPIAVSTIAWLVAFERMYGTLDPEAPYGSAAAAAVVAANIPRSVLGLLFDQKFGLLVYSPAFLLAAPGIVLMWRDPRRRTLAAGIAMVCVGFVLATARFYMWWGGSSAPARFLVPIVPLLAPAIAVAIGRLRGVGGRALVASTVAASLAIAVASLMTPSAPFLFSQPHGVSNFVRAIQGGAPLTVWLPTFTQEEWRAPLGQLALWAAALAIGCAVAAASIRLRAARSPWAAAATAIAASAVVVSGLFDASRRAFDRSAYVNSGRLGLMQTASKSELLPLDVSHLTRVLPSELLALLTIELDRAALDEPVDLPAGDFEALAWFTGRSGANHTVSATINRDIVLAERDALHSPGRIHFRLEIPGPVWVRLTHDGPASALQRVEIHPTRLPDTSRAREATPWNFEPIAGRRGAYVAYLDQSTYPENGVFWTRATDVGRVMIVPAGASNLRLTLHVGPNGGPVSIDVADRHLDVDLAAGETRDIVVPLTGLAAVIPVAFHTARAFRPSDVEPGSGDHRRLGCQVRPGVF